MADRILLAKRINNGQSEVWFSTEPKSLRVVSTNVIVYPVRTLCTPEESKAFHEALANGEAPVPASILDKLIEDLGLKA
ncbi:hypothetical protein HNQ77_002292 [Silvibacterium bohemicum]|uniref:Uncharacterized protein n=1 Tax=Silvibacterium bohemicum TaxID=1577686 RepID=A0A841JT55_9BACT|nr:hypothetical protein [Silvibacterium bohemicum]MBB6144340.1 hypothetical protein [Silvibacterium bohemicum]